MTAWHASSGVLHTYATGALDGVTACSVEAHLERCESCRATLTASADPVLVETMWEAIVDRVDEPRASFVERALRRVGLAQGTARLVAATPALRLAWMAAVAAMVMLVVLACRAADTDSPFLALAPLLPLVGVGAAFAPGTDPAGEIGAATPLFGFGLVLRRAEAVLTTSFAILVVGALALPGFELRDAGWVLPGLALSFATMALSGRFPVVPTASVLGGSWVIGITWLSHLDGHGLRLAETAAFAATGQLLFGVVGAIALTAVLGRSELSPIEPGA